VGRVGWPSCLALLSQEALSTQVAIDACPKLSGGNPVAQACCHTGEPGASGRPPAKVGEEGWGQKTPEGSPLF
jgi:hypothetical protein